MKTIAIEYHIDIGEFSQAGWALDPKTFFSLMGWKIPVQEYLDAIAETHTLYYAMHRDFGTYHWTKEGLLGELKEKGYIS